MIDIAKLIDGLIAREGDYVDHPADRGGPTRYGITQAVARANGYTGDMRALPIELARKIYLTTYWSGPRVDQVAAIAPHVAGELFDTGVNMGPGTAAKFLRRALKVLTGTSIAATGAIDAATIGALSAYLATRAQQNGEAVLVELLNDQQGVRYAELVEANPSQRAFVFGQIRNRVLDRSPSA
jgi:lysozyme family protein